jgi:hypothetical protein
MKYAEDDIRSSVILLLPLFITHNVDSSTVDLEQSNAEYDITRVVDSRHEWLLHNVSLFRTTTTINVLDIIIYCGNNICKNSSKTETHYVEAIHVVQEQPYDQFDTTHIVDSSTVELEQRMMNFI